MKIAKFTIKRNQIDHLIHHLKSLAKMADNPNVKARFVACNFLEMQRPKTILNKLLRRSTTFRVIIAIDKWEARRPKGTQGDPNAK